MRIAVVNWSRRKVGGIESYLDTVVPALAAAHEVAFWCELDEPAEHEAIALPASAPSWCVARIGRAKALGKLRAWHPQVVYAHGLMDETLEAHIPRTAPAVFFAHQYYGTCISGGKTWKFPVATACKRRFGPACLGHYYLHRCGGLNPGTMVREYRRQQARRHALRDYRAIVTHSTHMRDEYVRHGFDASRVHRIPFPVPRGQIVPAKERRATLNHTPRLLFLGRMDYLKGGHVLIDALPEASEALSRPLHLTFAGDGPMRKDWEGRAERMVRERPNVTISFAGWLDSAERDRELMNTDLLVVPSLWPEPFGMAGIEAGHAGVPSVAFAVGGIPDWLDHGRTGRLAPGDPPTASGLADAIVACLRDPAALRRMRSACAEHAKGYGLQPHVTALVRILSQVAQ